MATGIFINYRRQDTIATAGRIHDRLVRAFGRKRIFMDVDQIPAGADFARHIEAELTKCGVFLALIGSNWLGVQNNSGLPRLLDSHDLVTSEIRIALNTGVNVVPVLVDGASMPGANELPDLISSLTKRNAVELRNTQFGADADRLIAIIGELLNKRTSATKRRYAVMGAIAGCVLLLLVLSWFLPRWSSWGNDSKISSVNDCNLVGAIDPGVNFSGVFSGVVMDGPQSGVNIQLKLIRQENLVRGAYFRNGTCGSIRGLVSGDQMTFSWDWAGNSGRGIANQSGNSLGGTSGFQSQTSGGGTFVLVCAACTSTSQVP
jgi:hypothetical protein